MAYAFIRSTTTAYKAQAGGDKEEGKLVGRFISGMETARRRTDANSHGFSSGCYSYNAQQHACRLEQLATASAGVHATPNAVTAAGGVL